MGEEWRAGVLGSVLTFRHDSELIVPLLEVRWLKGLLLLPASEFPVEDGGRPAELTVPERPRPLLWAVVAAAG